MRLFAAIPLPDDTVDRLEMLQSGLPEGRLVPPENFHVTLGFFNDCDRHLAADIDAGLSAIRAPAPDLVFDGLGMFGDGRPRALYAALRPDPALSHLRDKVLTAARGAGVALKRERFVPHVTIARFPGGAGRGQRIHRWLADRAGFAHGPVRPRAFVLYRSDLGGGGAVHTELVRYPLAA
jgi:RNA 2',3'-cyclic 3'-phosphodiesterase